MAISQTKQAQLTTPEAVYDQPPAPRPNGTNSGKNRLSAGAITGMAVGGVVVCALSFVVGMQVGILQNGGMNSRAGGPPGMSQGQSNQQGGPSGQTGGALGGGQNQTQNSQTPSTRNNNSAAQNNQATPSGQSESTPQAPNNTSPQVN
jgi:hypothetical protein cdiviTM7_01222